MENKEIEIRKGKKKFEGILKENLQKIIIILVAIVYITQGMFAISDKDATILEILGNIGLSVGVGLIISISLNSMGLKDGRNSEMFLNSIKSYGMSKEKATPYFDKLSAWCDYKSTQELEQKKKEIIQSVGLNWKAYKLGYYKDHTNKLNEKQIKALSQAQNCLIQKIYSQDLLSDLPSNYKTRRNRFGESEREFKVRNVTIDLMAKLMLGIICGLYGLSPLFGKDNANQIIAGIIWNTLQISMWISLGLLKYMDAKAFIEDEYRHTHIIQKVELLNEFVITMQNNPKVIEEYSEDIEIDKYVEEYLASRNKKGDNNERNENVEETILDKV